MRFSLADHASASAATWLPTFLAPSTLISNATSPARRSSGKTGRHPLPPLAAIAQTLSQWGIDSGTQVVVYDDNSGVYAGRLWWMLRWLGHDAVAVLDGDWRAWQREGRPTRAGSRNAAPPHLCRPCAS